MALGHGLGNWIPPSERCCGRLLREANLVSVSQSVPEFFDEAEDGRGGYLTVGVVARAMQLLVVAGWAGDYSRDLGRIPLYSTSYDNKASQRVAEKLGSCNFTQRIFILARRRWQVLSLTTGYYRRQ